MSGDDLSPAAQRLLRHLRRGGRVVERYTGQGYALRLYRASGTCLYADAGKRAAWRELRAAQLVRRTGWLGPEAHYEARDA